MGWGSHFRRMNIVLGECEGEGERGRHLCASSPYIFCYVHLFNSGLLYRGGTFFNLNRLLIFLAFRLFPWGINQNLSERK